VCVCVCVYYLCIYICMMYVLYEYTGKQRPTFSSVRKVTLNGCYGINTNDNNNGVYPPPPPHAYTYIYGHCITSTPIIGSRCYLYCFYCSPSRFHPLLSLFYCTYISYIYRIQTLIVYTVIISSLVLYTIQSVARPEANIDYRPDEYIRYIIVVSPPST